VSAEIIPFIPRVRERRDETQIAFRSPARADDLAMDHADTAPCEILPTNEICEDD
jgi:hypothetical protein